MNLLSDHKDRLGAEDVEMTNALRFWTYFSEMDSLFKNAIGNSQLQDSVENTLIMYSFETPPVYLEKFYNRNDIVGPSLGLPHDSAFLNV